jgi:L-alanine-DL-glutamate epimerase-like enolase superfamily enzyme
MKRRTGLAALLALATASVTAGSGCLVGRHGHVALVPPPALLVAAAVAATVRPGFVWVEGHWDWVDGRWVWCEGEWIAERPGFVWVQGIWVGVDGGRYAWRPGHFRPAHVHVEVEAQGRP